MGKTDLVRALSVIERLPDSQDYIGEIGDCRIRLAGIIENAVVLKVLEVKGNSVVLRFKIGDEPPFEQKLQRGQDMQINFTVKSESLGLQ